MEQQGIGNIHFSSAPVAIKELKYSSTIGGEIMISGEDGMFLQISIPRDDEEVHHCYIATLLHSRQNVSSNFKSEVRHQHQQRPWARLPIQTGRPPKCNTGLCPFEAFLHFYISTFLYLQHCNFPTLIHCYIPCMRLLVYTFAATVM